MQLAGAKPYQVSSTALFALGARTQDDEGREFIYGQAGQAIAQYNAVRVTEQGQAFNTTTANTITALGRGAFAVAQVAFANDQYGWFQIYGAGRVNVASSTPDDTRLTVTTTAGRLDNASSGHYISGIVLTADRGSSHGDAPCFMNYPQATYVS